MNSTEYVTETVQDISLYHNNVVNLGLCGIAVIGFIAGLLLAKMLFDRIRGVR